MLAAAHRGYEYQDLLVAARVTDVLVDRIEQVQVDEKLFPGDLFDDVTILEHDGRRERVDDQRPLGCHATAGSRWIRFPAGEGTAVRERPRVRRSQLRT